MDWIDTNGEMGKPRREDYPVPPKPRMEDFPVVYEMEPNRETFRVSQQQFFSSDYPSWYGENGRKLYIMLAVIAVVLGLVITVIGVKTTEHEPVASIASYIPTWLLFSGIAFLVLMLLSPALRSSAMKTAEQNASRRCYESAVVRCREYNERLRSQQQRDYETAMRNWQYQKDMQDRNYESAIRAWQQRQDDEKRRQQNLKEEIDRTGEYLVSSGLVGEVAAWITELFRKTLYGINPDSSVMSVQVDCLIQVEPSRIVSISYEKKDRYKALGKLDNPNEADEYRYDFEKRRRKNLDSGALRAAMLMSLSSMMLVSLQEIEPAWAAGVSVNYPENVDLVEMADQESASLILEYNASNQAYEPLKKW